MPEKGQVGMFAAGESDPIFTGGAYGSAPPGFEPEIQHAQGDLFSPRCPICKDTGQVAGKPCICGQDNSVSFPGEE